MPRAVAHHRDEFSVTAIRLERDEHDPNGLVVAQTVEEVFVREALVLNLHLPQGVVIRTTAEHPFYEKSKGWVACQELVAGDELLCEDGSWVAVGEVFDTGCWETVYNLRVADFHTYFVGCDEWGFSVWAHNAYGQFREGVVSRGLTNSQARRAWAIRQAGDMDGFRAYLRARGIQGADLSAVQRAANLPVARARNLVPGGGLAAHEGIPTATNAVNFGHSAATSHTLATHVGRDIGQLRARLVANPNMLAASSFLSRAEAEVMVAAAIRRDQAAIAAFLASPASTTVGGNRLVRTVPLGSTQGGGIILTRPTAGAAPATTLVDGTGVRLVIDRVPGNPAGYVVTTAFPVP